MRSRNKKIHPTQIDRIQYDSEVLQKQMDLEEMTITLAPDEKLKELLLGEFKGQCQGLAYRRTVKRVNNEEGKFNRLLRELTALASEFGKDVDYIVSIYEYASGCKKRLRKHLQGNYELWSEVDDMILRNNDKTGLAALLKKRGQEEIDSRRKFLELA